MDVTPGQAQWVIERLIAERRISRADVEKYVGDMGREIQHIEERLTQLRGFGGVHPRASPAPSRAVAAAKTRKRRAGGKKGHPRGIAGTFAVLTRALPAADRAKYEAIRVAKGLKTAVAELRKAASRR